MLELFTRIYYWWYRRRNFIPHRDELLSRFPIESTPRIEYIAKLYCVYRMDIPDIVNYIERDILSEGPNRTKEVFGLMPITRERVRQTLFKAWRQSKKS